MRRPDLVQLAFESLRLHRLRTGLTLGAIAIGVTAVLLLTALGDAAKGYVVKEFAGVGTNLVIVVPGKVETSGGMPAFGGSTRDLTLEDCDAVLRQSSVVRQVAPFSLGAGAIEYGEKSRDVRVIGTTAPFLEVRKLTISSGQFLPPGDPRQGDRVVVLGQKVARELFQGENPLGRLVRIAQWRFRVIGVLGPKGTSIGIDYDDLILIPVSVGLKMFNQTGLFRIMVEAASPEAVPMALEQVKAVLIARHDDDEDFTLITQDAMLKTFSAVIDALTAGLAGIAAISLAVAGIGIMNVMLVSVSERTGEVGLLKALGARRRQIMDVFLVEAMMLSTAGAAVGVAVGVIVILIAAGIWTFIPLKPSPGWIALVITLAVVAGVSFGLMPARRAARLDAAEALGAALNIGDLFGLTFEALRSHRLRYGLSALAITVGVAAVVLLSSLGEGMRQFIMGQMTQFGTNLIGIYPGKIETSGMPGLLGGSARRLTLDDARVLSRLPGVTGTVPTAYGSSVVEFGNRNRRVYVYGATADVPQTWSMDVAIGQFLPRMDYDRTSPVVVLGPRLKQELFGDANALGQIVRVAESRFRVIGIMEKKGQFLGFDLDDAAYIPVANAMQLFNREIDELDLLAASSDAIDPVVERATAVLKERHNNTVDFTIVTQKEGQAMVDRIVTVVSGVVTGIAMISLLVGAIGILTIMWIVVQERVAEIGLAKAIGATRAQILMWYLFESAITALVGGVAGLAIGVGGAWLLSASVPGINSATSPLLVVEALAMALVVGVGAGVAPALRAASMDPVEALRGE